MSTGLDVVLNLLAGSVRGWRGTFARYKKREALAKPLKLYDIEVSPFCRLVREALTEMDLDVLILPCPAGGKRFRPEAQKVGGKQLFPLLVDDNTGTVMYESADIIDYLAKTYGGHKAARGFGRGLSVASSIVSSLTLLRFSGMQGLRARPSRAPAQPLELFSFETSPYSRPVRARLCELEIPYLLRNTGKGGMKDVGPPGWRDHIFKGERGTTRNRSWLARHTGRVQVPFLIDANTKTDMYESKAILQYLDKTYAL